MYLILSMDFFGIIKRLLPQQKSVINYPYLIAFGYDAARHIKP